MTYSFFVSYYGNKPHLDRCIHSIKTHHPQAEITVSQQRGDFPELETCSDYKVIFHDMRVGSYADCLMGMMKECATDVGIFMEHDCILLRPISFLITRIGDYDVVGVEDVVEGMRDSKGFLAQSFLIFNPKKFIQKFGLDGVRIDLELAVKKKPKNLESAYGVGQKLKKKFLLPVIKSGYAYGTFYGDYVHHFWYGSYQNRTVESDGVDRNWLMEEEERLFKAYDTGILENNIALCE